MIYNFKTCCDFKNKYFSIDTTSMLVLDNVYAISLNSLNVCATLIDEIPLGNTTYFDNGSGSYILIEGGCFDCLNDYYSCYPSVTTTPLPNLPISKYDCDPITIFPMGVQCVTLNPSTNSSTDGGVSLSITGGTPPYTTDWYYQDITFTGPLMINLSGGQYSATTTDFYGDFVVNSVCTLIAPTPTPTPTMTLTPTITPTSTPTPTPTPSTPPLEEFIINAVGVNQIYRILVGGFQITSSIGFKINWGDGNITTYSSGNITINHIYSTPYTGQIKILSTDLTTITSFISQTTPHNSQSLSVLTSELYKLDGLLILGSYTSSGLFITGDVINLPNSLTQIVSENNNLSGNTSNLPPLLTYLIINGVNTISGDTSGFPVGLTLLSLTGSNTVSGNTSGLPSTINNQLTIEGYNTISGDTSGLPSVNILRIIGYNTISGNTSDLPNSTSISINGKNTISGSTSGFTSPTSTVEIGGNNTINGDVSYLTSTITSFNIRGFNTITGDISTLPPNLNRLTLLNTLGPVSITIFGNVTTLPSNLTYLYVTSIGIMTGDLYNIPLPLTTFILSSNMTFTYTSGRVWSTNFNKLSIVPTGSWTGFNSTETDNLLIDTQPKYINSGSRFEIKCSSTPKRTSLSDTAFTSLQTLIGPANVILN